MEIYLAWEIISHYDKKDKKKKLKAKLVEVIFPCRCHFILKRYSKVGPIDI